MGAASAEAALDRVLRELRPGLVVSTGCAGALRPGLVAGDLLGAREVVGPSGKRLPSDCGWLERYRSAAERARVRFESGVLLSASEVLARAEQKRAARERTGCDAVDLESAAVAAQAARRGIPFAAVRAILDSEATSFPPGVADSRGHPRFGAIAAAIFRSPGLLVSFADLARAMVRCRSVLAAVHAELWRSLTET
jgi:uridine phosphorylase